MSGAGCLPPDPAVRGHHWLLRGVEWQVWEWKPNTGCWWTFRASIEADFAAETGWVVIGPAVPPCEEMGRAADVRLEGARHPVEAQTMLPLTWSHVRSERPIGRSGALPVAEIVFQPWRSRWAWSVLGLHAVWGDFATSGDAETLEEARADAEQAWGAWCGAAGLVPAVETAELLLGRIVRAMADLDAVAGVGPEAEPAKSRQREVLAAILRAWTVLTEGRDPPSRRRVEDAPVVGGEG